MRNKSHQHKTIILGDLNADLDNPKDLRGMEIVETIKSYQLRELSMHFKSRGKGRKIWTWKQVREGKRVCAKCDYILGGKDIRFRNFQAICTNFDSNHKLLWTQVFYE